MAVLDLEQDPTSGVVQALILARGRLAADHCPVFDVRGPGLKLDTGAWSGIARWETTFPYLGACGSPESVVIEPGESVAVVRLRGKTASGPIRLTVQLAEGAVELTSPAPRSASPPPGLAGRMFGH